MKYFIAFMLFLLINRLVPTAISAATNPMNVATHSVVLPTKKMSFKKELDSKLSAKSTKKITKIVILLAVGIALMLVGLVLFFVAKTLDNNYDALGGAVVGIISTCLGFVFSTAAIAIIFRRKRKIESIS